MGPTHRCRTATARDPDQRSSFGNHRRLTGIPKVEEQRTNRRPQSILDQQSRLGGGSIPDPYGLDVERRRREITAYHGVPDFVFRPVDVPKGTAKREVGDFLLWVGDVVAIVSHKSREPAAAQRETQDRRRRWLDSAISDAFDQIGGVARNLQSAAPGEIVLESERGVSVPWDPARVVAYVGAVVVDGPEPDRDYAPPVMDDPVPTIAMFAADWDRLNRLLPSTMTMIRYVANRYDLIPRCPMGAELDVFALIIEHEHTGEPIEIPASGLPKDHFRQTLMTHPDWFLGSHPEDRFAYVVDAMIEGAADADPAYSDSSDPLAYLRIIEFLDRTPLRLRVKLGKAALERARRAGRTGDRTSTLFGMPHGLMVFVADPAERTERAQWLRSLTAARHSQALDAGAPSTLVTLGVATDAIPSEQGRSHDFVYITGGIRSDSAFRAERDSLFGAIDFSGFLDLWSQVGATDR